MDCLFCKIINKDISADILCEDDNVIAFKDIDPKAPVHFLVIPKKHISTINDAQDSYLIGNLLLKARDIAKELQIDKNGFRLVMNCNSDGGQTVFHIHCHLLGGRVLKWPPG